MYLEMIKLIKEQEEKCKAVFEEIDRISFLNHKKVLESFQKNEVTESCFNSTTGYGYSDIGRDAIESVFSKVLGAEDSLVRSQFISGTHAISTALFACLRPNDIFLSINSFCSNLNFLLS